MLYYKRQAAVARNTMQESRKINGLSIKVANVWVQVCVLKMKHNNEQRQKRNKNSEWEETGRFDTSHQLIGNEKCAAVELKALLFASRNGFYRDRGANIFFGILFWNLIFLLLMNKIIVWFIQFRAPVMLHCVYCCKLICSIVPMRTFSIYTSL